LLVSPIFCLNDFGDRGDESIAPAGSFVFRRVRFRRRWSTAHFDAYAQQVVNSQEHRDLALQAAQEGIVLLKNEKSLLPLSKDLKTIAVIGPDADNG
jgi:beta-glucosidase-like glycosyl hydrolase